MADNLKEFSLQIKALELDKDLSSISDELKKEIEGAVENLAGVAYANIIAKAQAELHTSRDDYVKNLSFDKIGDNEYLITLHGDWPNKIEEGYDAYSMKEGLLKSTKDVTVGPRSGQKWVQKSKGGIKFAHVPLEKHPFSKAPKASDLGAAIRKLTAYNRQGTKQKITQTFKDSQGNPISGKVAIARSDIKNLDRLTKFQHIHTSKTGTQSVQSLYLTWRTVSENSKGWQHPGWKGLKAFLETEKYIEDQLEQILNTLIL